MYPETKFKNKQKSIRCQFVTTFKMHVTVPIKIT